MTTAAASAPSRALPRLRSLPLPRPELGALLREVEHVNDVNLYVWEPERESWRLLSMAEQRLVWERRLS